MKDANSKNNDIADDLSNRIFFRLYQCANALHKTGTNAVQDFGVTTQQLAVLGALSHQRAESGISVGELADFLSVSRQNLTGVLSRLQARGHISRSVDTDDSRSRRIHLTQKGLQLWRENLVPEISAYYCEAMQGFSTQDQVDTLHFLNKMLDNLVQIGTDKRS
ncbi:MAG: MarR family transcriptional regulator [Rhodobacteraceae bacterium]|nr:MarR family transcriptional regulator [Paracoccaceae bacterium]